MTPWLALLLLSSTSSAQDAASVGTLKRAKRTFEAVDSNRDLSLAFAELEKAGLSQTSFRKFDADASGSWSEADFLLYYEQLLLRNKRDLDADFQREMIRIKARRDPAQQPRERLKEPVSSHDDSGKAVLAIPEKSEPAPKSKPKRKIEKRPGEPAPPVVLDPTTVPAPRDGTALSTKNQGQQSSKTVPKNLLERAQKAQRQQSQGKSSRGKRTPG